MVLDNSPALGWIRVTNAVVTYRNKLYIIPDDSTEMKYIYWNYNNPSSFEKTNVILPETDTRFLVLINDNGMHTIVHSKTDFFNIAFDSGIQAKVDSKIVGLYEEVKDTNGNTEKKFSNILQQIDGITQTVGEIKSDNIQKFSEIRQKVDSVNLSVTETTSDLIHLQLRDKVIKEYLATSEILGHYEITLQSIMRDEKLDFNKTKDFEKVVIDTSMSNEENTVGVSEEEQIKTYNKVLKIQIDKLNSVLMEVYNDEELRKNKKEELEIIKNNIIPDMNKRYEQLINIINTACLDKIFITTEITSIYSKLQDMLGALSRDKSTIDKIITLGYGGKMIETVGKIFLDKSSGGFDFVKKINDSESEITKLKLSFDGFSLKVGQFGDKMKFLGSELETTKEAIRTKVSAKDFESEIKQLKSEISAEIKAKDSSAKIKLLEDKIENAVTKSDMYSLITQNSDSVRIAINKIGRTGGTPNFEFNSNGLTVNKGYIAVSALTVPDGQAPYISLFSGTSNKYGGKPQIDATYNNNLGVGDSIRFKWDDYNYLKVLDGSIDFYINSGNHGGSPIFQFLEDAIRYNGRTYITDDIFYDTHPSIGSNSRGTKKIVFPSKHGRIELFENGEVWCSGYSGPVFVIKPPTRK